MRFLPLLSILVPVAALAQGAPPPRPAMTQLFIAPSGEPFRAPADAPYPLATWFAGADHNHDGRIDLSEFTWDFDRFFDTLDTDHDGTLRSDEINRYERMVPELRGGGFASEGFGGGRPGGGGRHRGGHGGGGAGRGGGFGGGGGGAGGYHGDDGGAGGQDEGESDTGTHAPQLYIPEGGATRFELIAIPEPVTAMDTDLSGTITRRELHAAAVRRFGILDQKQRGYLTLDALPEPDALRHKGGPRRHGRR
ncbi:MAG: EF-hand domain-containing protein [Sphingomonas sp.]|jgi:hypothetical protein|uniref:EF-hand domain-containing protein n=1 Tax=Sphingomonas sp. TaxID=28214 RepID=UPI003563AB8F